MSTRRRLMTQSELENIVFYDFIEGPPTSSAFDTGIFPKVGTKITVECRWFHTDYSQIPPIFGSNAQNGKMHYTAYGVYLGSIGYSKGGETTIWQRVNLPNTKAKVIMAWNDNNIDVQLYEQNGTLAGSRIFQTDNDSPLDRTILIGGIYGKSANGYIIDIYSAKVEQDQHVLYDAVAAEIDGVYGLYDKISKTMQRRGGWICKNEQ